MLRRSLADATTKLHGIGLHTGAPGWVRFLPSDYSSSALKNSDSGLYFRSMRTGEVSRLAATLVADTRRCTALQLGGERLSTVEHLLSSISGAGVTDAVIEFDAVEVPILDGSATEFAQAIDVAGTSEMEGALPIEPIRLKNPVVATGAGNERLIALPSESFSVTVVIDYPERAAIGTQAARYVRNETDYLTEIASARTYGFLSEFEQVRRLGLASGASLENCVALLDDGSPDPRTPLRFTNELARHKLLDVIGDLALAGRPIQADIVAVRPSHTVNCLLAGLLASGEGQSC